MNDATRPSVFVLGTGRCGSSAATRVIHLLGLPLSRAGDVLDDPATDNRTGYWESRALQAFNERLLQVAGGSGLAPPLLEPGWHTRDEVQALQAEAIAGFSRAHPTPTWAWKDPRNCSTLPFWRAALGDHHVAIVVTRDVRETVSSMTSSPGLSQHYAGALWERRARQLLSALAGMRVLFADYGDLIHDPVAWAHLACNFLQERGVAAAMPPDDRITAVIDPGLRHEVASSTAPSVLSPEQTQLASILGDLSGAHDGFLTPDLPDETPLTEILLADHRLGYVRDLEDARTFLRGEVDSWRRQAEALAEEVRTLRDTSRLVRTARVIRNRIRQRDR